MRCRVAQHTECLGVAISENRDFGTVGERAAEIVNLPVDLDGDRCSRQPRTDQRGKLRPGRPVGKLALGGIWEGDTNRRLGHDHLIESLEP